jgi:Right handed beta helix region
MREVYRWRMRARIAALLIALAIAGIASAQPYSTTATVAPQHIEPGQEVTIGIGVRVTAALPSLRMQLQLPAAIGDHALEPEAWRCTRVERGLDCTIANVAAGTLQPLRVIFTAPAVGSHGYRVTLSSPGRQDYTNSGAINVLRVFRVTHGGDSGSGSLRQAIADANAECLDRSFACRIAFEPQRAQLQLASPLPAITAHDLTIDGNEAILDGRRVEGSGLEIRGGTWTQIDDLTIDSFGGDGVFILGSRFHVGLRGVTIKGNRFRGISMHAPNASIAVVNATITDNGRSGIALWNASSVTILGGTIARNGASGIFLWRTGSMVNAATITGNAQFGIAMVPGSTRGGSLGAERVTNNGIRNIDWALDGESPNDEAEADRIPNAPVLISARYDPVTAETTVRGRIRTVTLDLGLEMQVHVMAAAELQSDGTAAGASQSGATIYDEFETVRRRVIDQDFTVKLKNVRPGQYVSAYAHHWSRAGDVWGTTSEVSRAVRVE